MDTPILYDKNQFPTEEIIFSHIGKSKSLWKLFFASIEQNHPNYRKEWRYYNDGKSWLMKITYKKKTICWLSILKNTFRTTFYFMDKAKSKISKSELSKEYKEQFINGKKFGKIRGITILFKRRKDIQDAKVLMTIKESIK